LEIEQLRLISAQEARITVRGPTNQVYTVEVTTNLVDWLSLGQRAPSGVDSGLADFTLDLQPTWPRAFYRAWYRPTIENPQPLTFLDAPPEEPVVQHLPSMGMPLETETEIVLVTDGVPVSLAHLLAALEPTATVQSLNTLLASENLSLAGAVPIMNLVCLRRNDVTDLEGLATQITQLESTGLFVAVAANLGVRLSEDSDQPALQEHRAGESFATWTWDADGIGVGSGGNNAFELSRIPQLWNWLEYAHRQRARLGSHDVAVLEYDFHGGHRDLSNSVVLGASLSDEFTDEIRSHGMAVLGVIAAERDNGYGIQGVTPLPRRVRAIPYLVNTNGVNSYAGTDLGQMASLLTGSNAPRVINDSSGFSWKKDPTQIPMTSGETAAEFVDGLGWLWAHCFENLNTHLSRTDYLIVCVAGNESGIDARYQNPMANIACRPTLSARAPNFVTVENVTRHKEPNGRSNYDHSRQGDSVSAGGSNVIVLQGPDPTGFHFDKSGTSYAAPLVSGVASFLWSLDPSLTVAQMKSLLKGPATTQEVQSGERANLVDGFAAALGIDLLREDHTLHRNLVDVDDGTLDGNLRLELMHFSEDPFAIHTADGRRGDGRINMRDFRAFRDAWLQVIGETDHLDGDPAHFKKDLNFDGLVGSAFVSPPHPAPYAIQPSVGTFLSEEIYSRYDFNGNGRLDIDTDHYSAPTNALAPFKVDPDTPVEKRNERLGILRDVDVLLSPDVWEQDEENVLLDYDDGSSGGPTPYGSVPPENWTTNAFVQFDLYSSSMPFLWSFDLHLDMEAGNPEAAANTGPNDLGDMIIDGFYIDSTYRYRKARIGEWEGVVSVPFAGPEDLLSTALPPDFPFVGLWYQRTVNDEYHQYRIYFRPEPGEDVGLSVGFDEFQFYSNTRGSGPGLPTTYRDLPSVETIAKVPGADPYLSFYLPGERFHEMQDEARNAAIQLAGRLRTPDYLPGSPELEAIFVWENDEFGGVTVRVYGLEAIYRPSN
jgi:hypothetical protein